VNPVGRNGSRATLDWPKSSPKPSWPATAGHPGDEMISRRASPEAPPCKYLSCPASVRERMRAHAREGHPFGEKKYYRRIAPLPARHAEVAPLSLSKGSPRSTHIFYKRSVQPAALEFLKRQRFERFALKFAGRADALLYWSVYGPGIRCSSRRGSRRSLRAASNRNSSLFFTAFVLAVLWALGVPTRQYYLVLRLH
jgi:hypothetical protein